MKMLLRRFGPALLILLPSVLAFLPLAGQLGFYTDDWYSIYAAGTRGVNAFWQIFSFDRPARAFLMIPLYNLFGSHAPLYSYSAYAVRLLGALVFYWLLARIWPERRWVSALAALLYLLYPGFLEQPKAFDYQSHLWSVSAALISIALSVRAQLPDLPRWKRAALVLLSMPLTVFYLSQMEYFIGMEVLRLGLTAYVYLRGLSLTRGKAALGVLWRWLPSVVPVAIFLYWRVVLFTSLRSDTDLTRLFSGLLSSPLEAGWLLVRLFQDILNTIVSAWVIPIYDLTLPMRLRDFLLVFGVGVVGIGLTALLLHLVIDAFQFDPQDRTANWMVGLGLAAVVAALLPSALGDRRVEFLNFTRFTLPASPGVALIAAGILASFRLRGRVVLAATLVVSVALVTHFANALVHAEEWQVTQNFWHQMAWRTPTIQPGTSLVALYPRPGVPLEYVTWGPANLIYYPAKAVGPEDVLPLSAVVLTPDTFLNLAERRTDVGSNEKGFKSVLNYREVLVLWMPDTGCLKALDGQNLELSEQVDTGVYLAAPYSRLDLIDPAPAAPSLPVDIFGPEPAHTWCYYFQKASLARQRGDWKEAASLGDQALAAGYDPADAVEYMPFIEAYANQAEFAKADNLARFVLFRPWLRHQACDNVHRAAVPSAAGKQYLLKKFCG